MKADLDHVLRPPLPWRDVNMTECGREPEGLKTLTNEQFLARCKEYGQQRTALLTCMTCLHTVKRWLGTSTLTAQVGREIDRVGGKWHRPGEAANADQLENELRAVQLLINRYHNEFQTALADMNNATSLDQIRTQRRARDRYA